MKRYPETPKFVRKRDYLQQFKINDSLQRRLLNYNRADKKLFNLKTIYPAMRQALLDAGWGEIEDNEYDSILDCKFTLHNWNNIKYHEFKKNCWINHTLGEQSFTTKSALASGLEKDF